MGGERRAAAEAGRQADRQQGIGEEQQHQHQQHQQQQQHQQEQHQQEQHQQLSEQRMFLHVCGGFLR